MKYNIANTIAAEEIKAFRKYLEMTQGEFAAFLGVSKPTVERMEKSIDPIVGPTAILIHILSEQENWLLQKKIPVRQTPLRLWYMYREERCALIDVDDANQKVNVINYATNIHFRPFGVLKDPTYEDYLEFLKSRCFPDTRDKMKIQLEALGIPFYDPMMIIEKTKGRMAEDDFWIQIER